MRPNFKVDCTEFYTFEDLAKKCAVCRYPNLTLFHSYTQNFEKQVLETNNENKAKQNFT